MSQFGYPSHFMMAWIISWLFFSATVALFACGLTIQQRFPNPSRKFFRPIQNHIYKSASLSMRFDWREERAKHYAGSKDNWEEQLLRNQNSALSTAWAHELPAPEVGATLIQNPSFKFTDPEEVFMNGAVIFLVEHGPAGSVGLLLNRPLVYTLSDLKVVEEDSAIADTQVYLGGLNGKERGISVLHRFPDMTGAKRIIPGVCYGAYIHEIQQLRSQGRIGPNDFKVFLQQVVWLPGELEQQIAGGNNDPKCMWWVAACSSEMTMKGCIDLPVPLWRETCRLLGGKFSLIARAAYDDL